MYIAHEDDTGYLRLSAPPSGWRTGRCKVEIHVGEEVNALSLVGTMRFSVIPAFLAATNNATHNADIEK